MTKPDADRKKRRLTAAVIDYDTREVMDGLAPPVTYATTKKGAFMEYFKVNTDRLREVTSTTTPVAQKVFWALAQFAEHPTTTKPEMVFVGTQTALAELARLSQSSIAKGLKDLQAQGLVRMRTQNGLAAYVISPFHVWKGANALHRKAQIAWDRKPLKAVA